MQDDTKRTFAVAATLCLVCSVLVSTAAVSLKSAQKENQRLDVQKNILEVAGLYDENKPVGTQFEGDWKVLVSLGSGNVMDKEDAKFEGLDLANFDARKAVKIEGQFEIIADGALPQISKRARYDFVYEIRSKEDGSLQKIVLPIYGKGLWSTLYGFIALEPDCSTIAGITFYEHGETPGLGGEVDNKAWKASWQGKTAFGTGDYSKPTISVVKGKASSDDTIDGLSGATITSKGVSDLVKYWLGPSGFGKYLDRIRSEQNSNAE